MNKKQTIKTKLSVLNPHFLEITDESKLHEGHASNPNAKGESHFSIKIASNQLENLSRIKQHQIINKLLKEEFNNGLHALSIHVISK